MAELEPILEERLSENEMALLNEMTNSPAWKIVLKLWDQMASSLILSCCTNRQDQDYNQGLYAGFVHARRIIEVKQKPVFSQPVKSSSNSESIFYSKYR